ncbi:unnamed protein product [Lactuca virosa]|uniref:Transducin/WD40 repeat-like superfamily protein n=1 Tax=Lactuca virosa TaxID=75947 RepID=A0AAU9LDV4_9ASTR|nr:unnamed protein product [Lactuca virosa]
MRYFLLIISKQKKAAHNKLIHTPSPPDMHHPLLPDSHTIHWKPFFSVQNPKDLGLDFQLVSFKKGLLLILLLNCDNFAFSSDFQMLILTNLHPSSYEFLTCQDAKRGVLILSEVVISISVSGGRDLSLYLTDLSTRDSLLVCTKEHPIQWPSEHLNPEKLFQRGGSFLAGNLSFSKARASLEGSTPVPVYKSPTLTIDGIPGIVQHEILNNRRHVLTKDNGGFVKLWEITKGVVIEDYGQVSFEEKKEQLFEMVSIPAWFTVDTRLGSLSIHLDIPQCFSAEMYAADLSITQKSEDDKINLGRETLKGLLAHYFSKKKVRFISQPSVNGEAPIKDISSKNIPLSRPEADVQSDSRVYPPFQFSIASPPSIINESSQNGIWRKKITHLVGIEDDDFPRRVLDAILHNRMPPREHTKCSFYLHPFEGSAAQILTQGKLSAPRILRMHKVVNYVVEKMVLQKSSDTLISDGAFAPGLKPWKLKPYIEILCNNQACS